MGRSPTHNFAGGHEIKHGKLESVIKRLKGFEIIDAEDIKKEWWDLADGRIKYLVDGSPELQFFSAIPPSGFLGRTCRNEPVVYQIGSSHAIKNKWVEIGMLKVARKFVDYLHGLIF